MIFTILKIKFSDLLFKKSVVFGHKKTCTLVSWLFSPTFETEQEGLPLSDVQIVSAYKGYD